MFTINAIVSPGTTNVLHMEWFDILLKVSFGLSLLIKLKYDDNNDTTKPNREILIEEKLN